MAVEKTIKLRVDTGDSAKKVKEVDDGIKDTGKSARGAKGGFIGLTGGVKMLGMAFKAMGIGLIIAAFVKLKNLFSGNMETARKFERAGARVSAMFDVIRDRLEPLFEKLQYGSMSEISAEWKEKMVDAVFGQKEDGSQVIPQPLASSINVEEKSKLFWAMYKFYASNKRVFRLTNNLAIAMNNTKVNNFMGYVNIPYNSIYLSFPPEYFKYRKMTKLDDIRMPLSVDEASQWISNARE